MVKVNRQSCAAAAGLILSLAIICPAQAQLRTQSAGGASSIFGSGQSAFGSAAGSGFGGGGFGTGGFGAGIGQSGQFGGFGQQGAGFNQGAGQQQGFVGRDGEDISAIFEAMNQSGSQFLDRLERSFGTRNRGRGANESVDARPPIRVKLKLGFKAPPAPADLVAPSAPRFNGLLVDRGFTDARATVSDGVAVLEGTVAEDADRRMLARLARLEPGVRRVENRLTVSGASDAELPPPGN